MNTDALIARHGVFAEHCGYRLVPIFRKPDDEAREAIINLWQSHKLLQDRKRAEERAKQVVFMTLDPAGAVAGVSTAYVGDFSQMKISRAPAGSFYFYRMFIRPESTVHNLPARTLAYTYDYLNAFPATPRPQGLAIVTENLKLKRPGTMSVMRKLGWEPLGENAAGQAVMKRDFTRPC